MPHLFPPPYEGGGQGEVLQLPTNPTGGQGEVFQQPHQPNRAAQGRGRREFYAEYHIQVCAVLRQNDFVREETNDTGD